MTSVHYNAHLDSKDVNGNGVMEEAEVQIDDGKEELEEPDTMYYRLRKWIAPIVMSFGFRVFGLVLIFVDIILVIVDLSLSTKNRESVGTTLEAISLIISFFFLIDVLLRIYVEGFKVYFSSKLNIMDACIVVITLVVTMIYTFSDFSGASLIPRSYPDLTPPDAYLRGMLKKSVFNCEDPPNTVPALRERIVSLCRSLQRPLFRESWLRISVNDMNTVYSEALNSSNTHFEHLHYAYCGKSTL